MATKSEYEKAIDATQADQETQAQKDLVERAAKQAGPMGNDARAALRGEKKW